MHATTRRVRGFSFLEVLIVIAILGLLAAVAIPQFTGGTDEAQALDMVDNLSALRCAIDSYWTQHEGFPGPTTDAFTRQLLGTTDASGNTGTGGDFGLGPYLPGDALPTNPLTDDNLVTVVEAMPEFPDGRSAWIYCNVTGEIRCNAAGRTPDGIAYFDL